MNTPLKCLSFPEAKPSLSRIHVRNPSGKQPCLHLDYPKERTTPQYEIKLKTPVSFLSGKDFPAGYFSPARYDVLPKTADFLEA
jgi:hypothetical protein